MAEDDILVSRMKDILSKRIIVAGLAGLLVGVIGLTAVRFVLASDDTVHYHANFAVYIDGQRELFDNFTFYEEIQACGDDYANNPRARAHMHDRINHIIHVHDEAVTWGNFFENIGYTLSNDAFVIDGDVYTNTTGQQLSFVLNGQQAKTVANQVIRSEDVLLIDVGQADEPELQQRYDEIQKNAAEYNQKDDPSSCSGGKGLTTAERFQHAIGL
ncbi:hypothetical protein BH23PAT2_BH23PAT2_00560 [soil metagenome]